MPKKNISTSKQAKTVAHKAKGTKKAKAEKEHKVGEQKKKTKAKDLPAKEAKKSTKIEKKEEKQQKEHEKKWENLYKKAKDVKPATFRLSNAFSAKTALKHPIFGWGWIISNKNDRLQVMFKDKTRVLLSNQSAILDTMRKN